jgi:hypothetical protein
VLRDVLSLLEGSFVVIVIHNLCRIFIFIHYGLCILRFIFVEVSTIAATKLTSYVIENLTWILYTIYNFSITYPESLVMILSQII